MKILVTGGAGFIGAAVTQRLLERGDSVVGLDNINDYYDPALKFGRLEKLGINKDDIDWYKFAFRQAIQVYTHESRRHPGDADAFCQRGI